MGNIIRSAFLLIIVLSVPAFSIEAKHRTIVFQTEIVDGKTAWMPATVDAKPGEKLTLVFKHELKGGFDFHGIMIREFKIVDRVDRNKVKIFDVEVPKDLKKPEIAVSCQFHPAHVPAALNVKEAKK